MVNCSISPSAIPYTNEEEKGYFFARNISLSLFFSSTAFGGDVLVTYHQVP